MEKKGRKLIWRFVRINKGRIILAAVFALIAAVSQAFLPTQIQKIGDYIQENMGGDFEFDGILPYMLISIGLLLVYVVFTIAQQVSSSKAVGKIGQGLRDEMNIKLSKTKISVTDTYRVGDIQSRFSSDINNITASILDTIAPAPANMIKLLLLLILMFITNVYMTISVLIATVIGFLLVSFVVKKTRKHIVDQQRTIGELNSVVEESISGHMVIKSFHCEEDMINEFMTRNEAVRTSSRKSQFMQGIVQPLLIFFANFNYIAVAITAAVLFSIMPDSLTIGGMAAFILYAPMLGDPVNAMISFSSSMQTASASADRIAEVMEADEIDDDSIMEELTANVSDVSVQEKKSVRGEVRFEHLRFGYLPEQIVLKDLSATVSAGQKVAIVGPTGAGKSTLINLLMRFYEPNSGQIYIDGTPISEISLRDLHDSLGMVLQDTWTFQGTIRDNILYSTEGVTEEKLADIVEECGLSHLINTLPDGLDTVISEQSDISAGQRQLLTIARALAKDAPILILDEATSNVDTRSEALIQKAVDRLTEGRTSFVIAHRLSTIRNADCIFVMKDGDVVEMGKHEELLEKNGLYSELYYSQFDTDVNSFST
ncbi:MAG: ABC transporter ATP-binding protein [Eubacterium sp.]|nr:ABC transporter ATP-binding protein [Eubacterium sp.]MBR0119596.1 ABC transporter ATP-binding protein [Eubacterium sp.]